MWHREIKVAKEAAIRAAQEISAVSREDVTDGRGRDVKHRADVLSEKAICSILSDSTPYPVISEESVPEGPPDGITPYWVVDPLDGTVNYSRDIPLGCISIALWKDDAPLLGVVYDFYHGELFEGIVGVGARCNDRPISPSNRAHPAKSILATGFPVNRNFSSPSLQNFLASVQEFKKIRLFGSAALSLAYVACGRCDAYGEESIMLWDVAAGIALVTATGGFVKHRHANPTPWGRTVSAGEAMRHRKPSTASG